MWSCSCQAMLPIIVAAAAAAAAAAVATTVVMEVVATAAVMAICLLMHYPGSNWLSTFNAAPPSRPTSQFH